MIKSSAISRVTRLGSPRLTVISLLTSTSRVLTFAEASESAIERSDYKLTLSAASVAKTGFFIHWCCFGVEVPDHVKKDIEENFMRSNCPNHLSGMPRRSVPDCTTKENTSKETFGVYIEILTNISISCVCPCKAFHCVSSVGRTTAQDRSVCGRNVDSSRRVFRREVGKGF